MQRAGDAWSGKKRRIAADSPVVAASGPRERTSGAGERTFGAGERTPPAPGGLPRTTSQPPPQPKTPVVYSKERPRPARMASGANVGA